VSIMLLCVVAVARATNYNLQHSFTVNGFEKLLKRSAITAACDGMMFSVLVFPLSFLLGSWYPTYLNIYFLSVSSHATIIDLLMARCLSGKLSFSCVWTVESLLRNRRFRDDMV